MGNDQSECAQYSVYSPHCVKKINNSLLLTCFLIVGKSEMAAKMATMFGKSQASSSATAHKIYLNLSRGLPPKVKSYSSPRVEVCFLNLISTRFVLIFFLQFSTE